MSLSRRCLGFAATLLLTVGLFACSKSPGGSAATDSAEALEAPGQSAMAPVADAGGAASKAIANAEPARVDASQLASRNGESDDPARRFVRTADLRFGVRDVYRAALAIEDAAVAAGGFVVANRIEAEAGGTHERKLGDARILQLTEYVTRGSLVVRVPGDRTQQFLRGIAGQMAFLEQRDFQAEDVQFELLRRQLAYRRGEALEGDIAEAGEQPGRTGAKVDAAVARGDALAARDEALVARRQMEDQVAFATIRLALAQPAQVRSTVVPDTAEILRRSGPGFFQRLAESMQAGWLGLLDLVVAFVAAWPLWLVLAIVAAAVAGWRRRRGAHANARGTHAASTQA